MPRPRKAHQLPISLLPYVTDQVILVQALHNNNDAPGSLVVNPAVKSVVVPLVHRRALRFRKGLIGLERVIDDDKICTSAGQHSSHRGGQSEALVSSHEFLYGLPLG